MATAASAPEARAVVQHLNHSPLLIISELGLLDGSTGMFALGDAYRRFLTTRLRWLGGVPPDSGGLLGAGSSGGLADASASWSVPE